MTDYTMPVLSEQDREIIQETCAHIISRDDTSELSENLRVVAQIALAALTAKPSFWNIYHHNPDPNRQDNELYAECGPESGARAIASSIGGWVEPVYHGAPPVPVKQEAKPEGEQ